MGRRAKAAPKEQKKSKKSKAEAKNLPWTDSFTAQLSATE